MKPQEFTQGATVESKKRLKPSFLANPHQKWQNFSGYADEL